MRDYKEPMPRGSPRGPKRGPAKRFFGIMVGMVFAFAIFIGGVKVGIQVERERVHIAEEVPAPMSMNKNNKETTEKSTQEKTSPPAEKKDDKMQFTFYETLTKKEGGEKEAAKGNEGTAKKEQTKVADKKEETKIAPPKTTKAAEAKKSAGAKELYFVQIASFKEKEQAEGLKGRLVKKGYTAQVLSVQLEGKGLWYRVWLGGYPSLKEAQAVQSRISGYLRDEERIKDTKVVSGP
jgi:cell division protein FtsN